MKKLILQFSLPVLTGLLFGGSVLGQTAKPKPKAKPAAAVNSSPTVSTGQINPTATSTGPAVPVLRAPKKPIMSIFDLTEDQNESRQSQDSAKNCVIEFPKVNKHDIIMRNRIVRDVYFTESANKALFAVNPEKNIFQIILTEYAKGNIDLYSAFDYNKGYGSFEKLYPDVSAPQAPGMIDLNKDLIDKAGLNSLRSMTAGPLNQGVYDAMKKKCGIRIIEDWYLDTNRGEYKPFIVGIGFIIPEGGSERTRLEKEPDKFVVDPAKMQELFWVNYPNIRGVLCKYNYFNRENDQFSLTFDDVLQLRYFNGIIVGESDGSGDLFVKANPEKSIDNLIKAEEIKSKLLKKEQNLWEQ